MCNENMLKSVNNPPLNYYVLGDEVEFCTDDFFEKYGFGDGDMISDLYYEYMADVKGINLLANDDLRVARLEVSPLYQVIKKLVLPKIKQKAEIKYYITCHNGIRCEEDIELKPRYIYVPIDSILRVFDDIYDNRKQSR